MRWFMMLMLFAACTTKNPNWDNGGTAKNAFEQQRDFEESSFTRNQMPTTQAGSNQSQPL